jgi:hypothetical protein
MIWFIGRNMVPGRHESVADAFFRIFFGQKTFCDSNEPLTVLTLRLFDPALVSVE